MQVEQVMTSEVVSVQPETTYKEVVEQLLDHDVSGVPVIDDEGRLVGVVTEADLLSRAGYDGGSRTLAVLADVLSAREHHWATKARGWTAGDLMSRDVASCTPQTDVRTAAREMLDRGVTRLPVVRENRVVGIVARQDVLRALGRQDAEIATDVERVLWTDVNRPDDHHVVVSVKDGRVTLTGDVRYPHDAPVVVAMARGVEGVIGVESRLHSREHLPPATAPTWPSVTPVR
jgi:CBS domain-containing protein